MNTPTRVAGFLVALGAIFGIALGVGQAVGPSPDVASASAESDHGGGHGEGTGASAATAAAEDVPGGLMVSQSGYTFSLADRQAKPGRDVGISFTIDGPTGKPVTEYEVEHEKRLHLIAVRRDFTGFQHVHPELGSDGVWSTKLDLTAGQWRLFADFKAADAEALTLGADLAVDGDYRPDAVAGESRTAQVDGYTVTLEGDLNAGQDSKLTLDVSRDGEAVADLQPYLGAYGHLVALRSGDLAYLHVHPDGTPGDGKTQPGPEVVFYAAVPSAGTYHLFLDFRHEGVVRTAAFTVSTRKAAPAEKDKESSDDHGH
jgi:hypothetical protein